MESELILENISGNWLQTYLIILIIVGIICGFATDKIAMKKHYTSHAWFLLGLFLGFIGVAAAIAMPYGGKTCPQCSERVLTKTRKCPYCTYLFIPKDNSDPFL